MGWVFSLPSEFLALTLRHIEKIQSDIRSYRLTCFLQALTDKSQAETNFHTVLHTSHTVPHASAPHKLIMRRTLHAFIV